MPQAPLPRITLTSQGEKPMQHRNQERFARVAAMAGADEGRVRARLTIDPAGEVTRVEIDVAFKR